MNIILGDYNAQQVREKYTVLELDRFRFGADQEESAYCVIEKLALGDFEQNPERIQLHEELIADYRERRWGDCASKIECLRGSWSGEMDSFYDEIAARLEIFATEPPDADWDYRILK